ncbi:hypothetical protein [Variovorax gossypii]
MRTSLFAEIPVTPSLLYPEISDIPKSGFRWVEVEPIAAVLDVSSTVYFARIIASPEDGPLALCSVYLRQDSGGVVCIGDFSTKEDAMEYATQVGNARDLEVRGSLFDLRVREVPGMGYVADPRETGPYTRDPAKAALYHSSVAQDALFAGVAGQYGRWVDWYEASNHALTRTEEKAQMLSRVADAVHKAMGPCAPAVGSEDELLLRGILRNAVEDTRSDRLVVFDSQVREYVTKKLEDAYVHLDGAECDEDLCATLLDHPGEILFDDIDPAMEQRLLHALASAAGVAAIETASSTRPRPEPVGMLSVIHQRLAEYGAESPYADLVDDAPAPAEQPAP